MTPKQFKDLREMLGFSQVKLAEELEMANPTICNIENGSKPVKKVMALAMKYLLEIKIKEIQALLIEEQNKIS